jgi:hypothetical protein
MLRCSRFLPALILSFGYACIVPVSILVKMHSAGWHWIWNDTAYGFSMLLVSRSLSRFSREYWISTF